MQHAIECHQLSKRYGAVTALDGISATVRRGQVVGLLGHNGAGKSTLVKLVLGLIAPSGGELVVLGKTPWGAPALRRRIGYLPENAVFYPNLSGEELLMYLARLKRAPRAQVAALLERVGLADASRRRVGTYSKGMRQRLGLAQALLGSPELLLLDEPTTGLDPQASRDFYRTVAELRAEGCSVLISSHLLAELEPHIDAALILRQGRLLASGGLTELNSRASLPASVRVRVRDQQIATLQARLAARGLAVHAGPPGLLEFPLAAAAKLPTLGELAHDPDVVDLEVREPSLAQLYDWLGSSSAFASEHARA